MPTVGMRSTSIERLSETPNQRRHSPHHDRNVTALAESTLKQATVQA